MPGKLTERRNQPPKTSAGLFLTNRRRLCGCRAITPFFQPERSSRPLKDKNVRLALTQATDKKRLIGEVLTARADCRRRPLLPGWRVMSGVFSGGGIFSGKRRKKPCSRAAGKTAKTALKLKTGDRELRLEFNLVVPGVDFLIAAANLLKEQWGRIGVKINPVVLGADEIGKNVIKTRNYEMILFGNVLGGNPDLFLSGILRKSSIRVQIFLFTTTKRPTASLRTSVKIRTPGVRRKTWPPFKNSSSALRPAVFLFPRITFMFPEKPPRISIPSQFPRLPNGFPK